MEVKGVSTRKNLDFNWCKIAMSRFIVEIAIVSVASVWVNFVIFHILVMLAAADARFVVSKGPKHKDFPIVRDMPIRLRTVPLLQLAECESSLRHGFVVLHKIASIHGPRWKFCIQWLEGSTFQEDSTL
jgi:hypothetical protein